MMGANVIAGKMHGDSDKESKKDETHTDSTATSEPQTPSNLPTAKTLTDPGIPEVSHFLFMSGIPCDHNDLRCH
jgi:hypothetical protein